MIASFVMLVGLLLGQPQQQDPLFGWLVGKWCTEARPPSDRTTCEEWRPMVDGVIRGTTQTRRGGKVVSNETMEVRRDGTGWVFHAEPSGQPPADFRAGPDDVAELAVSFENAGHDYPQRIRYWRDGDKLMAEIAMADGSRPVLWEYRRAAK